MSDTAPNDADLLNEALAAEHAAAFAYPVIAARDAGAAERAERTRDIHRDRADAVAERIEGLDAIPVAPLATYDIGAPDSREESRAIAQRVEQACLSAYARVIQEGTAELREFATDAMIETAEILLGWRAEPEAFPGLDLTP